MAIIIIFRKFSLWTKDIKKIKNDTKSYIKNPLNGFKLIKRNSIDLEFFEKFVPLNALKTLEEEVNLTFATIGDLHGAIKGLVRLHRVYQLTPAEFANGIINGIKTGAELSLNDVFTIGFELAKIGFQNYLALEYLKLAEKMNSKTLEIDPIQIKVAMMHVHGASGDMTSAQGTILSLERSEQERLMKELFEFSKQLKPIVDPQQVSLTNENPYNESFIQDGEYHERKEAILLHQTCREVLKKSAKEQSKLFCHYYSTNAFTKLARFKIEIVVADPEPMMLFHGVLSDTEIEEIERLYGDSITENAGFFTNQGEIMTDDITRVADLHSFEHDSHAVFKRLKVRLQVSFLIFTCFDYKYL